MRHCLWYFPGSVAGWAGEEGEGILNEIDRAFFVIMLAHPKFMRTYDATFFYCPSVDFFEDFAELGDLVWGHFGFLNSLVRLQFSQVTSYLHIVIYKLSPPQIPQEVPS